MNRQRFLAELRRLLVYMSDEDREEAVRRCAAAFEAAGPDGEAALIDALGTPTRTAIALSRGYEPGKLPDIFSAAMEAAEAAAPVMPEEEPAHAAPDALMPELPDEPEPDWITLPGEEASEEAVEPAGESRDEEREEALYSPPVMPLPEPEEDKGPEYIIERSMHPALGIPLFILVFCALGIPLAALCAALTLILLAPGCAILFGAYLTAVGGLWCLGFMADAVLLFGLSFVILAAGILVFWLGLWLAVLLFRLYFRGVRWIAGELLGRKVIADA